MEKKLEIKKKGKIIIKKKSLEKKFKKQLLPGFCDKSDNIFYHETIRPKRARS